MRTLSIDPKRTDATCCSNGPCGHLLFRGGHIRHCELHEIGPLSPSKRGGSRVDLCLETTMREVSWVRGCRWIRCLDLVFFMIGVNWNEQMNDEVKKLKMIFRLMSMKLGEVGSHLHLGGLQDHFLLLRRRPVPMSARDEYQDPEIPGDDDRIGLRTQTHE